MSIVSQIYLKCQKTLVQLSVFHIRGEFHWICEDSFEIRHKKWFGDTARALNRFNLTKTTQNSLEFFIADNLKQYLFDYNASEFIECNHTLAAMNLNTTNYTYAQNLLKNSKVLPSLRHLVNKLEKLQKHYWLAAGTLLGWYRDCGIIPHTTDIDMGLRVNEFTPEVEELFKGDPKTPLILRFGLFNDSYELRLDDAFTQFDLFFTYAHNETHQWCGWHDKRKHHR